MFRTLRLSTSELTRRKGPLFILALLFLLVVPCLYGALYLWSNWDPYGKLDDVPVAVVNEDVPVTVEGKQVAAGSQVVSNLKANPSFKWIQTDAADAAKGLEEGTYYMTITIPKDFSSRLASGSGGTPQRAEVQMRRNDANGFVVGIMAETVAKTLHDQINSAAVQSYFESVYGSLDTLRNGIVAADDGAHQLADGLDQAAPGARTLADGLGTAVDGANQLADGATQVAGGTQQIADLVNPLADTVVPKMPAVAQGAADVQSAVSGLTQLAAGGTDTIATRADGVNAALEEFLAAHPDLAGDPALTKLQGAVGKVDSRAGEIATAVGGLNDKAQTLNRDAQALVTAVPDLQAKLRTGQSQINTLNTGAHQVADGAGTLAGKLVEARDGAGTLADGIGQADDGAHQLADGLDQMVAAVPAMDPDQREANAAVLGNPTDVELAVDNPAHVYGRGLAPFFFSIALWVFGIVVFLVLTPTSGRTLAQAASPVKMALVGWLPVLGIGLAGSYILFGVSWFALGLDPVHAGWSLLVITVAVVLFTLIAHLLRSWLGLVGSAVLLVFLMIQLTSSGGIYPPETLPALLRAINPYLPMTYLVDALRVTFTGGSMAHLSRDLIILSVLAVAAFAGTVAVQAKRRTWSMATVHPALGE